MVKDHIPKSIPILIAASLLALVSSIASAEESTAPIQITVHGKAVNPVDHRLFGQFMERASFGEPGPETVVDDKGNLPEKAVEMLKSMEIPVVRFPGGTDIEYIDWRDMIDNVPGREGKDRPVSESRRKKTITNRFGYDEYFKLRDRMGWETILVLNTLDAVAKRKPLAKAVRDVTGLVAYANAPVGATLPEGMPDWPAIRAANGHPEPFKADYIQVGNETWMADYGEVQKKGAPGASDKELAKWYYECVVAMVRGIRAIDPEVKIIVDARTNWDARALVFADPYIMENVSYGAFHEYSMGDMTIKVYPNNEKIPMELMDSEDWWAYWTSIPGKYSEDGMAVRLNNVKHPDTLAGGLPLACTEWNWNRWGYKGMKPRPKINWQVASALGTAAFLHNLIRHGEYVRIATQSMLLGASWEIAAIRVDPEGEHEPYFQPQGQATVFYSKNHGDQRLETTVIGAPRLSRPGLPGTERIQAAALVDCIATRSADSLFVHFVNRSLEGPVPVKLDLSAISSVGKTAELKTLQGDPFAPADLKKTMLEESATSVPIQSPVTELALPPHAISILKVPLAGGTE